MQTADEAVVLSISRGTSVILLGCYISYLAFQLYTHHSLFDAAAGGGDAGSGAAGGGGAAGSRYTSGGGGASGANGDGGGGGEREHEQDAGLTMEEELEEAEAPELSMWLALTLLTIITLTVAVCSEYLTGAIEAVSEATGLGQAFLGMIVLPIAGNACEHFTAIIVAMKNKMDLALGVAVGSSIQIALFAIPFVVIVAWAQGLPFSLDFDDFSALTLALSVIHANNTTNDASSHWLLGVQLVAVYAIIAIIYLYR
eukprot:364509-Chlamydomonas_euryale.AAC.16